MERLSAAISQTDLTALCRALGVQRSYRDGTGTTRTPDVDALIAVLRELGAPMTGAEDAAEALRELRQQRWRRILPPVLCAEVGDRLWVSVRAPGSPAPPQAQLVLENGEHIEIRAARGDSQSFLPKGMERWVLHAPVLESAGYHSLEMEMDGEVHTALVLAAPPHLPEPAGAQWALFAPLYALHTRQREELATFTELGRFGELAHRAGASHVATLPLLAGFLGEPLEPSPYSPLTRCFWNELYVDVHEAPELRHSPAARRLLESGEHRAAAAAAIAAGRIDYGAAMHVRRAVLELLVRALDERGNEARRHAFEADLAAEPELARYAAFRAALDEQRTTWPSWPADLRDGRLGEADFARPTFRYHAYAQWLARQQVAQAASASGAGLYLDLPIGSHGGGYDTWRWRDAFATAFSAGAPPDALFDGGQNWAFPPLHPERVRRAGYAPLRAALRHHFSHASVLRIDHILGFHRLFWIPPDAGARDGVYVGYRWRELWSVLAIEAARVGAIVVGEDLGTVPGQVRRQIRQRRALRMYVMPFEGRQDEASPLAEPRDDCLACLGTHDTAPFATWWETTGDWGRRILAKVATGAMAASGAVAATGAMGAMGAMAASGAVTATGTAIPSGDETGAELVEAQRALLAWLGRSDASIVLANLEDLWLEREPQNRPGTDAASGNWQRRAALSLEEIAADPGVRLLLEGLDHARRSRRHAKADQDR
ncbi:MAG TPA: 4-alpha-glucanotransferase [Candidatus Binatia bacterium]|nr:4-alpha-glucanotransferase [Candidatus Binatia bacterium]